MKDPHTSAAYVQMGRIRVSYRTMLSLGGKFNVWIDFLNLNIALEAFLHSVSIAVLNLPLGTKVRPR